MWYFRRWVLRSYLEATVEVIPEAVQRAFAACPEGEHRAQEERKAHKVVVAGAAVAGDGGGSQPDTAVSDAALLVPIQIGMLAGISATFGIELSKAFLGTLMVGGHGRRRRGLPFWDVPSFPMLLKLSFPAWAR